MHSRGFDRGLRRVITLRLPPFGGGPAAPAHGGLALAWAKGHKGVFPLLFTAVPRFVRYRGSGSRQTSLYKTFCHFRIMPRRGCSLSNDRLQALSKQAVGADAEGEAICHLFQLLRLVDPGGGAYPQLLSPEGAETAMDRPSAHVNCSHAGEAHSRVGQGGHLGVVLGGA